MIERISSGDKLWDLCIVGTGPVGMALALEFERLGREVLCSSREGAKSILRPQRLHGPHIVDSSRHAAMEIAVCRALGGTSWMWSGRCVAFDDVDWMPRDFVADARWPIRHDEIRPWYARASEYLLCGTEPFLVPI